MRSYVKQMMMVLVLTVSFSALINAGETTPANTGPVEPVVRMPTPRTYPPIDYDAMLRRRMERIMQLWNLSDEKRASIEPLFRRVLTLQEALRPAANLRNRVVEMGAVRPGQQPMDEVKAGTDQVGNPNAAIAAAFDQLLEVSRNPQATDEQITEKLQAYQKARQQVRDELQKAAAQLREQLTLRQQAELVLQGMLE